nr:hypothetical protein [uncultured Blautia sp.]
MKRWMLGFCSILTLLSPMTSHAAEEKTETEKGVLGITSIYSDSITPQGGDEFSIILADDEGNTTECTFQAYEHQEEAQFIELDPGNYSVYDITYNGESERLIAEGFIMPYEFTIYELEHLDVSLAIGKETGTDLASTYVNTYSVINGEMTDWIEYYSPKNNPEPMSEETSPDSNSAEEGKTEEHADTEDPKETAEENSKEKETSEAEKNDEQKQEKPAVAKKPNFFVRNLPIILIMGITAIVVFILHKKGKI